MTASAQERANGRIAAFWSAHMETPISADDVRVMLRLAELAEIPLDTTGSAYLAKTPQDVVT